MWRDCWRRTWRWAGLELGGSRGPAEAAVEAVGISCRGMFLYRRDMIVAVIMRRIVVLGRVSRRGLRVDGRGGLGVGTVMERF